MDKTWERCEKYPKGRRLAIYQNGDQIKYDEEDEIE
jgi:hypothetical protein